ncbi:MAG TPA: outer membrane insertion C- signal [Prolixibacteraceae bacterium]|nr:outer membrane insertion C- signal [Prolixibacteraceae bacterium]
MKRNLRKLFIVAAIIIGGVLSSNAQEIGVRFGGTNGAGGAAIDAVFSAGQFSRIHADLGFYRGGLGIDALWDFIYKPLNGEAFNWYLGVGPSTYLGDSFWLGMSGEIGLEYRFSSVPIAIGADWRPTLWVVKETRFGADSFGLNVRFVF